MQETPIGANNTFVVGGEEAPLDVVRRFLSYHIIPSGAFNTSTLLLANGTSLPTNLPRANLTIIPTRTCTDPCYLSFKGNSTTSTAQYSNIPAGSSIIHFMNAVLLPPLESLYPDGTGGSSALSNTTGLSPAPVMNTGVEGAEGDVAEEAPAYSGTTADVDPVNDDTTAGEGPLGGDTTAEEEPLP
jgi:hypothetical protein